MKSKRRKGRQNKKRTDKDGSSSDEETDNKDFGNCPRCRLGFERQRNVISQWRFLWQGRQCGYQMFPEPKQSQQSPPGQATRKLLVASSDEKKQKPKKLNHESIEIVAMAHSTVPKAEKTKINRPKDSRCYWTLELHAPYFSLDKLSSPALCAYAIHAPSYLRILLK
jgi:hypothetical protein